MEVTAASGSQLKNDSIELLDLPDELILKILSHVPRRDLSTNARPTCSRLRDISYDLTLRKVIDINQEDGISSNGICKLIENSPHLSNFSVRGSLSNHFMDREVIEHLYQHAESLKILSLEYCFVENGSTLFKLINRCQKLVTLKLSPYISLNGVEYLQLLPSLKEIVLFFMHNTNLTKLKKLIAACPNVKNVTLYTPDIWFQPSDIFPLLETENNAQLIWEYCSSCKYVRKFSIDFPITKANNWCRKYFFSDHDEVR